MASEETRNLKKEDQSPIYQTKDLKIDFLAQIYDIIRCLEKETQESSQPKMLLMRETSQSENCGTKMAKLKESFETFRQTVVHVPGISVSKDEQLQTLKSLRQQLIMKRELLMKYKNSNLIDNIQQSSNNKATTTNTMLN